MGQKDHCWIEDCPVSTFENSTELSLPFLLKKKSCFVKGGDFSLFLVVTLVHSLGVVSAWSFPADASCSFGCVFLCGVMRSYHACR